MTSTGASTLPPQLRGYEADRRLGAGARVAYWVGRRSGDAAGVGLSVVDRALAVLPGFSQRLAAVARQIAPLRHPRIVGTVDVASGDAVLAVVTEEVDGVLVSDLVASGGQLAPAAAAQVVDDVLRAVGAAHAAGIVHCGILPERVLVTPAGEVRLDGFAVARTLALTGGEVGAPAPGFSSPERLGGALPDGVGDLYSAAALAHLLFTGSPPAAGEAAATPALPGMQAALARALAVDPQARYPSASTLRTALTGVVADTLGEGWRSGSDLGERATAAAADRSAAIGADAPADPAATHLAAPPAPAGVAAVPARAAIPVPVAAPPTAAAPVPLPPAPAAPLSPKPLLKPPPPTPPAPAPVVELPPAPPPVARPAGSPVRRPPRARRRVRTVLVAVLGLACLAGAGAGGWVLAGRPNPFGSSGSGTPPASAALAVGTDVALTVTRDAASGAQCDVTFNFVATGSLSGRGNLIYHFEQSNGQATLPITIPITTQTRFLLKHAWRFQGTSTGQATLTFVITQPGRGGVAGAPAPIQVARQFDKSCPPGH